LQEFVKAMKKSNKFKVLNKNKQNKRKKLTIDTSKHSRFPTYDARITPLNRFEDF